MDGNQVKTKLPHYRVCKPIRYQRIELEESTGTSSCQLLCQSFFPSSQSMKSNQWV